MCNFTSTVFGAHDYLVLEYQNSVKQKETKEIQKYQEKCWLKNGKKEILPFL